MLWIDPPEAPALGAAEAEEGGEPRYGREDPVAETETPPAPTPDPGPSPQPQPPTPQPEPPSPEPEPPPHAVSPATAAASASHPLRRPPTSTSPFVR